MERIGLESARGETVSSLSRGAASLSGDRPAVRRAAEFHAGRHGIEHSL